LLCRLRHYARANECDDSGEIVEVHILKSLDSTFPDPSPGAYDRPFWEGCECRRLLFPYCNSCGRWGHPSLPGVCCANPSVTWEDAKFPAFIFSYTMVCYSASDVYSVAGPYIVVLVNFPKCNNTRLLSNLTAGNSKARIGDSVELKWGKTQTGILVPQFELRMSS